MNALWKAALGWALVATLTTNAAPAPRATRSVDACAGLHLRVCPEPDDAMLPAARDMLSWEPAVRVVGFRNMYRLYQGDVFRAGTRAARPLAHAETALPEIRYQLDGRQFGLDDYLDRQHVTGLLILKDEKIVYEHYARGNTEHTLWTSRSVAKSVVSVLIGIAIREGRIHSVDDPITRYLPELRQTAWADVTLAQLMHHTSGVRWNETYSDPASDFAALTRCEALPEPYPCVLRLVRSVGRLPGVAPGERWAYNTGGAWLVGRVLERATGMTIARYLQTRLWSREPMEQDGVWHALVPGQVDMGGHGFNATLRDWGRFAAFVARGGHLADGTALLPEDWMRRSTTWTRAAGSATDAAPDGQYGYQWWRVPAAGTRAPDESLATIAESFWALGIYGQAIAIDPTNHLIMVQWATWDDARPSAQAHDEQVLFFAALAHALRASP